MLATILCVFLSVLFGTRNGRKLVIKVIRNRIAYTSLSNMRFVCKVVLTCPHFAYKLFMDFVTQPIDSDNEWVRFIKQDTWKGSWIESKIKSLEYIEETVPDKDLVILCIHGGGFALGNALMYLKTYQLIIDSLKEKHNITASILAVDYSLSRESQWPTATNQCFDAYQYLVHQLGVSPTKIIIVGDSAGGNLVCSTLLKIQEYKSTSTKKQLPPLSIPVGVVLLSPWMDLSVKQYPDSTKDILTEKFVRDLIALYLPDWNTLNPEQKQSVAREPLISPVFGDYSHINCSFFIAYGEYEILRPEIESFISKLKQDQHDVYEFYGEKQTHTWFVSPFTSTTCEVFEQHSQVYIDWMAKFVKK